PTIPGPAARWNRQGGPDRLSHRKLRESRRGEPGRLRCEVRPSLSVRSCWLCPCRSISRASPWTRAIGRCPIRAQETGVRPRTALPSPSGRSPSNDIDRHPPGDTMAYQPYPDSARLRTFICHASNDKPDARLVFDLLRLAGAEPWLDEKQL